MRNKLLGGVMVKAFLPCVLFKFKIKTSRAKEIININTLIHVIVNTCNSLVKGKIKGRTAANNPNKQTIKYNRAEPS